jgi:RNA polymerase sigma-70 factor (ECF subfamily)
MGNLYDRAALDRLMVAQLPAALSLALKLTGSADEAEELVQKAVLRAARAIHSFRADASFRTWFTSILINCFRDSISRRREVESVSEDVVDVRRASPLAEAAVVELEERVARAVSQLPPRQREVLVLSAYERMETSQIARVLSISEANVRKNMQLARDRLRVELADAVSDEVRRESR